MKEYLQNIEEVLKQNETSETGISTTQAQEKFNKYGKNKLAEGKKTPWIVRFLKELADPMVIILIIAAIVSLFTALYAHESFADVIIIMVVVLINAILGVVQESKAEKAIEALQEMSKATTKVIRDQQVCVLKSEELVPGDIILLEAGDAIPADARIIECVSLKVEEAALTGESVPVEKQSETLIQDDDKEILLGDRKNMLYMGSNVVYGRAKAVIVATGMETEMGKIASALTLAKEEATPLQKKLNQLSKMLSILVLAICVIIFAVDLLRADKITSNSILSTFMIAVSLAVAAIPEGLAAVVTIVLSIGVTNMSKKNAIIRKLTAVETLGCTQIICSDKTGTLTQNKMTVVQHSTTDEPLLGLAMSLCNDAEIDDKEGVVGEPTECALVQYGLSLKLHKSKLKEMYPRIGEAPFDSNRKMMSTVHKNKDGKLIQFSKGAPDEVLKKCSHVWLDGKKQELTQEHKKQILDKNHEMANQALRVLCAAMKDYEMEPNYTADSLENNLCYIGLVGMIDPIREEVKDAIVECKEAGIKPIMITGDHKDTAIAIAKQLGIIEDASQAITGADLNQLSDEELLKNITKYAVYARVQPEHKVRIVKAWKQMGKITAMTGDGVNDAPSIKNADIGVGMGITGTDVTKNVSDMVLADDNFATIVSAVEEGRRVYDNIRKSIQFLLSSNMAEVLSIFISTLIGFTILKPAHLLWINLITDCLPAIALGMEESEEGIMKRSPRGTKEGIFSEHMWVDIALQGLIIAGITILAYLVGCYLGDTHQFAFINSEDGMTMAFLTLSLVEIFHSFNMRSRKKSIFSIKKQNKLLWISAIGALILTTAVIYIPFLSNAFGFKHINFVEYSVAILLALSIIPIVEMIKLIQRKVSKKAR